MKLFPLRRAPSSWLFLAAIAFAGQARAEDKPAASSAPTVLPRVLVTPPVQTDFSLGTSTYTLNRSQIETIAQGSNSTFNQVLIRVPGVSQDSAGQVHFREEDPYYQYYLNGVLLPRAINGFGQDMNTRFVDSVSVKVGALPAQYAWGNYGIISVQTKTGDSLRGGEASVYGGSYDAQHASVAYGGATGKSDYYFTGSYLANDLGIENPTDSAQSIHDHTRQFNGFAYISRKLSGTSSLSFIASASHADFQIPNNPNQVSEIEFARRVANFPVANSANLNETQTEQTYYGIAAYQQTMGDLSFQFAQVNRYSGVLFRPDVNGDLYFNGVAGRVFRDILLHGLQADFTYQAGGGHTVRGGLLFDSAAARDHNAVSVFAAEDDDVNPITGKLIAKNAPFVIHDNHYKRGFDSTLYLQDEWKTSDRVTLNFGGRFDQVEAYVHENQLSPRLSAVYQAANGATWHAGYARYFIPPPLENVSPTSVAKFRDTTNASEQETDDPVKCERSNYYDVGVTHSLSPELQVGLDAYYKEATNQIDDGQFGAANIFSPYNRGQANICGVDLSASYIRGGFSAYGNFSASRGRSRGIVSSQFEFEADELDYIAKHDVYLDQTQFYTATAGASYAGKQATVHADLLYGSGMRTGFASSGTLPAYHPVNVGLEHRFEVRRLGTVTLRLDIINAFDENYILNDGTGISVGAPRFGNRRGFYGGISCQF